MPLHSTNRAEISSRSKRDNLSASVSQWTRLAGSRIASCRHSAACARISTRFFMHLTLSCEGSSSATSRRLRMRRVLNLALPELRIWSATRQRAGNNTVLLAKLEIDQPPVLKLGYVLGGRRRRRRNMPIFVFQRHNQPIGSQLGGLPRF